MQIKETILAVLFFGSGILMSGYSQNSEGQSASQQGQNIFEEQCAQCHGRQGGVKTNTVILKESELNTSEIKDVIRKGRGRMPDFGSTLSKEQIKNVAAYVEELRKTDDNSKDKESENKESAGKEFIEIIERDKGLSIPETSYVPQDTKPDKRIKIEMNDQGEVYLGNGVIYKGFVIDGKIPGPTVILEEGDIVEWTVENVGTVVHGLSIHAAYTQTSKYLGQISPGESKRIVFRVTYPGVYMYHCAPGGHAIPIHTLLGQYGMVVVKPKEKFELEKVLEKEPDLEIYLLQHEYYSNGKDAVEGQGRPMYVAYNGQPFRYVEDPIMTRPGDYVRIHFLNVGPNLVSTLHLVGIIWDFAYWQGHPDNVRTGGQTVTAGPSDSWTVEFRVPPDEGDYTIVTHAFGSASKGAIGLLRAEENAQVNSPILTDGPVYNDEQWKRIRKESVRTISPFEPGSPEVDVPKKYPPGTEEVIVRIIGNSYSPKVVHITPGTRVKWINEDIFPYLEGEFSGRHDVFTTEGPAEFKSPLLKHGESYSYLFTEEGEYKYLCRPHPYMKGIIVVEKE